MSCPHVLHGGADVFLDTLLVDHGFTLLALGCNDTRGTANDKCITYIVIVFHVFSLPLATCLPPFLCMSHPASRYLTCQSCFLWHSTKRRDRTGVSRARCSHRSVVHLNSLSYTHVRRQNTHTHATASSLPSLLLPL